MDNYFTKLLPALFLLLLASAGIAYMTVSKEETKKYLEKKEANDKKIARLDAERDSLRHARNMKASDAYRDIRKMKEKNTNPVDVKFREVTTEDGKIIRYREGGGPSHFRIDFMLGDYFLTEGSIIHMERSKRRFTVSKDDTYKIRLRQLHKNGKFCGFVDYIEIKYK